MTSLTRSLATVFLLLGTAGLHAEERLASIAMEKRLKDVVVGHYQGITENSFEEAVRFYHSDSPEVARVRIEVGQAAYFQKTATLSFVFVGQCEDLAFGTARHRFLRIAGVKFTEEFAEVEYVFRKEGSTWKLWMTETNGLPKKWSTKSDSSPLACDTHFLTRGRQHNEYDNTL